MTRGTLVSLNVGAAEDVPYGNLRRTAIDKRPVEGEVFCGALGLAGDVQVDEVHHGGRDQAVYAYAEEDLAYFGAQHGVTFAPGSFGENLTTRGVDVNGAVIGEKWRIGRVLLEVTSPRVPCSVFAGQVARLGVDGRDWVKRFTLALRPGPYLRVLEEGVLRAGDAIDVLERPAHGVTVAMALEARSGAKELWPRLAEVPQLSERMKAWLAGREGKAG